jgi:hypothetical protein
MTPQPSRVDEFLKDFQHIIANAESRLREISPEQSQTVRVPGHWTQRQIVGHLIDSATNNHQRFVRAQFSDELVFPGYQQEEWVEVQKYNDESWPELIQLWASYNRHLIHVVSAMPADIMTKPRVVHNLDQIAWKTVPKTEPATLEYFVRDYVGHLQHHLKQIFSES